MESCRHKPSNVRHVHHEQCAHFIGNFPQLGKINHPRIGRGTSHNQFGLALQGRLANSIIVQPFRFHIHPVGDKMEILATDIHRAAMGQVSAMGQVHAHDRVSRLKHGKVDRHIGLCAGMGLHIGMLCPKELASTIPCQVFHHIHVFTSAVVAVSRVTFSVLIGQRRAHGCHHRRRHEILRCNQLDMCTLPFQFLCNGFCYRRIRLPNDFQFHENPPLS